MHLVGCLYYWQMGFNSVFKGLNILTEKNHQALWSKIVKATLSLLTRRTVCALYLNFGTVWCKQLDSGTGRFSAGDKTFLYFFNREPGSPQFRSGIFAEETNLLPSPGSELRFLGHPACSLVSISTELSWLPEIKLLIYKSIKMELSITRLAFFTRNILSCLPFEVKGPELIVASLQQVIMVG